MNDSRNAHKRLDALLTGLEDEVMRGEGGLPTDVTVMRAELEELIARHTGKGVRDEAALVAGGVKGRVAIAKELMSRWAGIGQRAVRSNALPRVSMAFSGKRDLPEGEGCSEPGSDSAKCRKKGGEI